MQLPLFGGDRRAVGEHHDHPLVDGTDRGEHPELLGWQVDMCAVEPFGLVARRKPQEDQDGVRPCGGPNCVGQERVVVGLRVVDAESRSEVDGHIGTEPPLKCAECIRQAGRVDLGAAGALEPRAAGELADDSDPAQPTGERQDRSVVLE